MSLYCRDCFYYGPKTSRCYCEDSKMFRTFVKPLSITCKQYRKSEDDDNSSCADCAYYERIYRECETLEHCMKRHIVTDEKIAKCEQYISTKDYCKYLGIPTEEEDMSDEKNTVDPEEIDCFIDDGINEEEIAQEFADLCKRMRDEGYQEGLVVGCAITKKNYELGKAIGNNTIPDVPHARICRECRFWTLYDEGKRPSADVAHCRFLDQVTEPHFSCRYGIRSED